MRANAQRSRCHGTYRDRLMKRLSRMRRVRSHERSSEVAQYDAVSAADDTPLFHATSCRSVRCCRRSTLPFAQVIAITSDFSPAAGGSPLAIPQYFQRCLSERRVAHAFTPAAASSCSLRHWLYGFSPAFIIALKNTARFYSRPVSSILRVDYRLISSAFCFLCASFTSLADFCHWRFDIIYRQPESRKCRARRMAALSIIFHASHALAFQA